MGPKKNRGSYLGTYVQAYEQQPAAKSSKRKKSPKNAFFFYMQNFREWQEAKGIFYKTQKEVADAAASSWQYLSAEERKPYQDAAKEAKEKDKADLHNKFTTEGRSYADVNKEEQERREHQEKILHEIRTTVRSLRSPPALINYPFYVVHVNYYCKTSSGIYVPCELGVAEFTLGYGVRRALHSLINPGDLPLGYKYEAEKHSGETHGIPLPDELQLDGVVRDYAYIFQNLNKFLRETKAEYKLPPLYTRKTELEPCENVLAMLCDSVNEDNIFRIYPLEELFFELQHACVDVFRPTDEKIVKFPYVSLAEREIEKDAFKLVKKTACDFHESTDYEISFCSVSYVQRWSFVILDYCHEVTKMSLIAGQHVPEHTDVSRFNKLRPVQLRKYDDMQKLSTTMQNLHVSNSKYTTLSPMQPKPLDLGKQAQGQSAASAKALRVPKQISEAMNVFSPNERDEEFPALGS